MQTRDLRWKKWVSFLIATSGGFGLALLLIFAWLFRQYSADRANALRGLQKSEERYRDIFENTSDLIQSVNPDGTFCYTNASWKKTLGYTDEDLKTLKIWKILALEDRLRCMGAFRKAMSAGESAFLETRVLCKNGSSVILEGEISVRHDPDQGPVTRGMFRDITKRKTAEQALTRQGRLFETVINCTPNHVYLKDAEGRYSLVNKAMSESFGLKPSEMIGFTDGELLTEPRQLSSRNELEQGVRRDLKSETIAEEAFTTHDGDQRWLHTVLSPLQLADEHGVHILGHSVDITDTKKSKEQAFNADKMASIGTLAGGVAHEFKNYLAGIIGNTEYLRDILGDRDITGEEEEVIADIIGAADSANEIAMSLLTYSRRKPESISTERISELAEETLKLVRKRALKEGVEIVTSYDSSALACVSASKIQQLILNLLGNAIDATTGGGVITVVVTQSEGNVILRIGDSGSGIPTDKHVRIFEPFFSTKGVWGRSEGNENTGTGLGLSICRNIAEEHGGSIGVSSIEGAGTTFEVRLPAFVDDLADGVWGETENISSYSHVVLFAVNRELIERYQSELAETDVDLVVKSDFDSLSWDKSEMKFLVIVDGSIAGIRDAVSIPNFCNRCNCTTVMINRPLSDTITDVSSVFDHRDCGAPSLHEIVASLGRMANRSVSDQSPEFSK